MAYITAPSLTNLQQHWQWQAFVSTLKLWRRRARERTELARMSAAELRDLGLSRAAVAYEANKPFWRA
jgi:uncharacterized protein YjiS (DUF1127 family)